MGFYYLSDGDSSGECWVLFPLQKEVPFSANQALAYYNSWRWSIKPCTLASL